jgi:hypothetical protein
MRTRAETDVIVIVIAARENVYFCGGLMGHRSARVVKHVTSFGDGQ